MEGSGRPAPLAATLPVFRPPALPTTEEYDDLPSPSCSAATVPPVEAPAAPMPQAVLQPLEASGAAPAPALVRSNSLPLPHRPQVVLTQAKTAPRQGRGVTPAAKQPTEPVRGQAHTPSIERLGSRARAAEGSNSEALTRQQQDQQPPKQEDPHVPEQPAAPRSAPGSRSSSRAGQRPGSAGPRVTAAASPAPRPASARLRLEERVARAMERRTESWSVQEVADYVEHVGLGCHRRAFVHHVVDGPLLLALTDARIKMDLGICNLGHREALLQAIAALRRPARAASPARSSGSDSPDGVASPEGLVLLGGAPAARSTSSSRPGSPSPHQPPAGALHLLRAQEQRARLMHELGKAEAREAHRRMLAEQAVQTADAAADQVRRLRSKIAQLDEAIAGRGIGAIEPFDQRGRLAWLPTGTKNRARGSSAGGGGGSPGAGAMSPISLKIMSTQQATFLERLDADISQRRDKIAAARNSGTTAGEAERRQRDLEYLADLVQDKSAELHAMLGSGSEAEVDEALADIAEMYAAELGLSDDQVQSVKAVGSPGRRAARLAGYVRSAHFMARLEEDLATREGRLRELQQRWFAFTAEGRTPEAQDGADREAGAAHFALLGWGEAELRAACAGAGEPGVDARLDALLRRAEAAQCAAAAGKDPDWSAFKNDGLEELQEQKCAALRNAAEEYAAVAAAGSGEPAKGGPTQRRPASPGPPPPPLPTNYLQSTVELLARCQPSDLATLATATGPRKLLLVWRAVRSQQFVHSMASKEEERRRKQAALERELFPNMTKRLPREQLDAFFDRLSADAMKRASNRETLAEKAKAEALAKLLATKPRR